MSATRILLPFDGRCRRRLNVPATASGASFRRRSSISPPASGKRSDELRVQLVEGRRKTRYRERKRRVVKGDDE